MKKIFITLFIVFISFGTYAQISTPVSWEYRAVKVSETEYELQALALIDKPWHLYGQYFEDGGPVKLKFEFSENNNFTLIDSTKETPKPKVVRDEIFDIDVHYFEKKALFTQKVKIIRSTEIILLIEGQICNDKTGMCVMVRDEHIFMLK